jgi:hypothetical protein
MITYALVVGSVIVGLSGFIIKGGIADSAKNMTGVEYLEQLARSSPLFFTLFFAFLIVFTLFGFFHTVRWTYAHECHRKRVKKLTKLIGLMGRGRKPKIVWEDLDMDIPPMELLTHNTYRKLWKRLMEKLKDFNQAFRTRYWFPALYFVMLILFAICSPRPFKCWAIGCLVFAFWLGIGFFCSEPLEPSKPPRTLKT